MDRKETPGQHWDREQVSRDTAGSPAGEQGEVWNRHQMEIDDTGTDADAVRRTDLDDTVAGPDTGTPDMSGISGRGQPSGESHWDRVEPDKD